MPRSFGEVLKFFRTDRKFTQKHVAQQLGIPLRTYQGYENGEFYPKDTAVYARIAQFYDVSVDDLLNQKDLFLAAAQDKYGVRGRLQARKLLENTEALFAGGSLSEEDEEAYMRHMIQIFERVKARNRAVYAQAHAKGEEEKA